MNSEHMELKRDTMTDILYEKLCYGEPIDACSSKDVIDGIERAIELSDRPAFLEGLSERLTGLGTPCTVSDTEIMLSEVKRRFKDMLDKTCPKAVENWIRGGQTGLTNRRNNYDLCYALEMDFKQTSAFFIKNFLTIPFNSKSKDDAIYLYCIYHQKPYSTAAMMLDKANCFVTQENSHTQTSQISRFIFENDDDEKFMQYLSAHCYEKEQQFQVARELINGYINKVKENILVKGETGALDILSPKRLNSLTIAELLGQIYQHSGRKVKDRKLPRQFTESLPNDVNLGKIINGDSVTYEILRKALMLFNLYDFYNGTENSDEDTTRKNLLDFYDEVNDNLYKCGFAPIYEQHPFDCLLLYCANSYDPILTLQYINEH